MSGGSEQTVRVGVCDRDAAVPAWEQAQVVGKQLSRLIQSLGEERFATTRAPQTPDPKPQTRVNIQADVEEPA